MKYVAKAKYIPASPFKLRPFADVVRGKNAEYAVHWFATNMNQRVVPLMKALKSAIANAKSKDNVDIKDLVITDFRVDQGPMFRYFKAGAMGRATIQRRRFCHINVVLENK